MRAWASAGAWAAPGAARSSSGGVARGAEGGAGGGGAVPPKGAAELGQRGAVTAVHLQRLRPRWARLPRRGQHLAAVSPRSLPHEPHCLLTLTPSLLATQEPTDRPTRRAPRRQQNTAVRLTAHVALRAVRLLPAGKHLAARAPAAAISPDPCPHPNPPSPPHHTNLS